MCDVIPESFQSVPIEIKLNHLGYRLKTLSITPNILIAFSGGGPRVVVSTAAFHARVRGSVPGLGAGFERNKKCFFPIHV